MIDFEEELKKLPTKSGVYIMHGKDDVILYVGKAINLRNRVRSYFRASTSKSAKIEKMVSQINRFEYIATDSELEALVLENNLIKEHSPKYNTMLKDDKTYPYIKVTSYEDYPRLLFSREMKKDKCKYFGPFKSAIAVRDTIDILNKVYGLRNCNRKITGEKSRECLSYHMKQCVGPCNGEIDKAAYGLALDKAISFLNGNHSEIIEMLKLKMEKAAEELEFEEAVYYRDLLTNVTSIVQKQKITDSKLEDKDIVALAREEDCAIVQVFFVREGKLIGREHFYMEHMNESKEEILSSFVKQFYAGTPFIPRTLMLQMEINDKGVIEEWLTQKRGMKVTVVVPKIGAKEKLVELAATNARLVLSQDKERIKREEGRTIGAVKEIAKLLQLENINRMEAFDISNISGFENVGSMVVFEKGKPKKSDYRKFKIKSVEGMDDYSCMREVLTRRLLHGLEEKIELSEKNMEEKYGKFTRFPDIILMDGGKGQVNIALQVLDELGIDLPVCGMVKDDNHRTRGIYYNNNEIDIDTHSEGFKLITRIQDEAHRFAIEYHRSLRSKTQVRSVLDDIPGVGENRRKVLVRYFQSIDEIKKASVEELESVEGIPNYVAENIFRYFH